MAGFTMDYLGAFGSAIKDYFIFCGIAFVVFYFLLRRPLANRKITPKPTEPKAPLLEIGRTIVANLLGKVPFVLVLAYLVGAGWIPRKQIYTHIADHSWFYFGLTIVFDFLVFDLWFYLSHRFLLHSRWGYKHIHIVHHRSVDPTPFARNSLHPLEGVGNSMFHILPVFLIPHHPMAIVISASLQGLVGVMDHLGFEIFWPGFSRHWLSRYFVTPVHHHLHHSRSVKTNFSFFINYDLIFGTQSPEYHEVFEKTVNRRSAEIWQP
jgi:sterol desaturase/sphingolipid hydroxylase (fatty acid hydroxylase superfamily)